MKTRVTYRGVDLEVTYDWEPEDPMVMYYGDGSGNPGRGEQFLITDVTHKGESVYELLAKNLDDIELLLINQDIDGC